MAKSPAITSALALTLGRDINSITHSVDVQRKAGTLPPTKRGRAAVDATVRDAATILAGVIGADVPVRAPEEAERLRSLKKSWATKTADPAFSLIGECPTFGDALETTIRLMPDILAIVDCWFATTYPEHHAAKYKQQYRASRWDGPIKLTVKVGRYSACILLQAVNPEIENLFEARYLKDNALMAQGFYGPESPDETRTSAVTGFTLFKLWQALNDGRAA